MIRDTSAQDRMLKPSQQRGRRLALGGLALASSALLASLLAYYAGPTIISQFSGGASVGLARLSLASVELGPLTRDIAAEGRVVAANSPTLYAGNPGTVSLKVQAGDQVKRGQVLLTIASPELTARLGQERANADALQSEWLRAQADARQQRAQTQSQLETASISFKTAQNDLARQSQAFQAGATAAAQVDQARDTLAKAQVALKQSQELLGLKDDAVKFELQAKRQAYERQALVVRDVERQLDELNLRSPVDGQVGQLFITDRASVARDAKLLSVVDLSALEVQIQVAESLARELQPNMAGEISGAGGTKDQKWQGLLSSVSPEVVNGEVAARLRFAGPQPAQLRQNQRLSVRMLLDHKDKVLTLSRGSFVEEGGGHFAYVLQADVAEKRAIKLGLQSLAKVEVLEGLKAGEQVVISGADNFKDAQRVSISR
ncbi:MAG: HlyD family efflux transporter periplasmic adaptor subunit [Paucibacter sp.]|nr:HlyD family efflux transporter periplasmic adaptor subunit [Roseateles sp.]